jgi:TRAP-type C4-dicarboxylate transport system permease small subunit
MNSIFYRWIIKAVELLSIIGIMLIVVFTTYEVLMRQVFGQPTIWTNEISCYLLVWFGLLAIVYAYDQNAHVSVDLVYERLSLRARSWCNLIEASLSLVFLFLLFYYGLKYWWMAYSRGWNHTGSLDVPMSYTRLAIPLVAALLVLQAVFRARKAMRDVMAGGSQGGGQET